MDEQAIAFFAGPNMNFRNKEAGKHPRAPSGPPTLFMFSLASFILFLIRFPPAPAHNISICQSLRYFGNAVLKLLSHVAGPPPWGWERDMVRESG